MFSGKLTKPEDFIVREILDERFSRKYRRTCKGVEKMCGEHSLYLLQKKNMNTRDAINLIAKKLCISRGAIGYAGLKDKNAVSYQYITISKGPEKNLSFRDIALTFMRSIDRRLGRGDLIGNEFEITLHNCRNVQELPEKIKKIRQGIPNFFGPQRFGVLKNNHIKGRMIIHRRKLPENMGKEDKRAQHNVQRRRKTVGNKAGCELQNYRGQRLSSFFTAQRFLRYCCIECNRHSR
ncbi:MAG: tRNA pseudouridine(13) synthase TruD [Candidatus Aenigmarchaeota archaeon]|nr:tRNA pseudouridine(13) synthase TruD [Candidatus Aenigmarchaeota archaeon]